MGWFGRSRDRMSSGRARQETTVPSWAMVLKLSDYLTFLEYLEDLLLDRELDTTREGGVVLVRGTTGAPLQLGLQTLAQQCAGSPLGEWRGLMASHLDAVLTLGATGAGPGPGRRDFESVRSLLKVRLYPAAAVDGDPDLELISWRPADDLVAALAYDLPHAVTSVPSGDAQTWGRTESELLSLGLDNLQGEALAQDRIEVKQGVSLDVFHGQSFFVAAQLLRLTQLLKDCGLSVGKQYGYIAAVPTRHILLYHCLQDARALLAVNALIPQAFLRFHQGPGSLSPSVYWLREGGLLRLPTEMTRKGVTLRPPVEFLDEVLVPLGAAP